MATKLEGGGGKAFSAFRGPKKGQTNQRLLQSKNLRWKDGIWDKNDNWKKPQKLFQWNILH